MQTLKENYLFQTTYITIKKAKNSDVEIIAEAKVTIFAWSIMLPSILEKHKICLDHTKSLPIAN